MAETLSYTQLFDLLRGQGATNYEADQLSAIAMAESGGNTGSSNYVGETSIGMFQINLDPAAHGGKISEEDARDPVKSAQFALQLFRDQGLVPWTVTHAQYEGTSQDYRQYLKGNPPNEVETVWPNSLKQGTWEEKPPSVMTPPDVYGSEGQLVGSELGLDSGGANFTFEWPDIDDYDRDFTAWADATAYMASIYGAAGIQMPAGVSDFAKAAWHAARQDAEIVNDPTAKALNIARAAEIAEKIRVSGLLTPYDIDKIKQDIRLAEPFGSEKVLRSPDGQRGFNDYWADKGPQTPTSTDYMAGFNLARAGDEPRQTAVSSYLDRVIEEIGLDIELRGQNITAASAEMRNKIDLFDTAQRAFTNIQPFTIPAGSEYIPGFEPEGFAVSIGLKPQEATPIRYNPFKMAVDIQESTPAPTSFEEPSLPGVYDQDMFQKSLDWYRGML